MLQADATPSAAVSLTEDERVHAVSGLLQEKGEPGTRFCLFQKGKKAKKQTKPEATLLPTGRAGARDGSRPGPCVLLTFGPLVLCIRKPK